MFYDMGFIFAKGRPWHHLITLRHHRLQRNSVNHLTFLVRFNQLRDHKVLLFKHRVNSGPLEKQSFIWGGLRSFAVHEKTKLARVNIFSVKKNSHNLSKFFTLQLKRYS